MVAARMPGRWDTSHHHVRSPASAITQLAWDDLQHHSGLPAGSPFVAVLYGPRGEHLLLTPSADRPGRYLAGALVPVGCDIILKHTSPVPRAILVHPGPARAVAAIVRRFLPRYDIALHQLRINAVSRAHRDGEAVLRRWDEVSDGLCDEQGFPLCEETYGQRQEQRDADMWTHFNMFLTHGDALLDRAETQLADLYSAPEDADLHHRYQHSLRQLRTAHGRGLAVRFTSPAPAAERNADIWNEMSDWLAHTPRLLTLASQAGPLPREPFLTAPSPGSTLPHYERPSAAPPGPPAPGPRRSR
jgi:hypothetical protein